MKMLPENPVRVSKRCRARLNRKAARPRKGADVSVRPRSVEVAVCRGIADFSDGSRHDRGFPQPVGLAGFHARQVDSPVRLRRGHYRPSFELLLGEMLAAAVLARTDQGPKARLKKPTICRYRLLHDTSIPASRAERRGDVLVLASGGGREKRPGASHGTRSASWPSAMPGGHRRRGVSRPHGAGRRRTRHRGGPAGGFPDDAVPSKCAFLVMRKRAAAGRSAGLPPDGCRHAEAIRSRRNARKINMTRYEGEAAVRRMCATGPRPARAGQGWSLHLLQNHGSAFMVEPIFRRQYVPLTAQPEDLRQSVRQQNTSR